MKRVILCSLLVCITLASVCQMTKTEIANTINKSKEVNFDHGIINPDKIQIGQTLTFLFQDGTEKIIIAEKGDSQWKILSEKISALIAVHGPVVPFPKNPTPEVKPSEQKDPIVTASAGKLNWDNFWITLLVAAIIAFIASIFYLAIKHKREAKKDPVTSGPAMLPGGVTDENALAYATEVANRQFPNYPNLNVREVQRGRLSGENLEVFYAGNVTPQRRTFTNQPAYRGIVNLNGADQFVYFLQGCGNDVRRGNYFAGENIQFIADTTATVLRPQPVTASTEVNSPVQLTSQTLQVITAMAEVLKNKNSGSMIIEGNKVEVFFSTNNILFSANGHLKNIVAIAAPAAEKLG